MGEISAWLNTLDDLDWMHAMEIRRVSWRKAVVQPRQLAGFRLVELFHERSDCDSLQRRLRFGAGIYRSRAGPDRIHRQSHRLQRRTRAWGSDRSGGLGGTASTHR